MSTLTLVTGIVLLLGLFLLLRSLYQRSMRIRNRLQMDRAFTNISHELLTPLTVISASIERLRQQEPGFATDYALMELNVERMTRLLQQILETSKSQSGELKLLVSQGDVMAYIRQTALCIEPLMHKQGLRFTMQCTPQSMMGWIDTDKVDKIIYNLLSNAAKYTPTPGTVTLEAHTNKNFDQVVISVSDSGIGIPPERMKRLFHRFHDGDYRRMRASGTGLGLALTRDLVYLHGGNIDCQSQEGKGTTFTVVLPISKESFAPAQIDDRHTIDLSAPRTAIIDLEPLRQFHTAPAPPLRADELGPDAYRVLLVEDNEELLMMMRMLLGRRYHIETAANGVKALEVLKRKEVDLIVTDVMMPQMDGNELLRAVKGTPEYSHLPVILLTAKTSEDDREASLRLGADDYVVKPFRLGDLQLRIDNIVENRKRIMRERQADEPPAADQAARMTPDEVFMQKARQCVVDNLGDAYFDREAFAALMGASSSSCYKRLRAINGMNVSLYIRTVRLEEARRMAQQQPSLRVSDLAYKVGFKDPKYFATCFKNAFGIQPKEFLEQIRAGATPATAPGT